MKPVGVKKGAMVEGLSWQMYVAIGVLWGQLEGHGIPLVLTSGREGKHGKNSLHYSKKAIDIRTRNIPKDDLTAIVGCIEHLLDSMGFDIVLERDHLHLEWDPKKTDQPLTQEVA